MKILLTGMTAPHTTLRANTRALSFAGQIVETLGAAGYEAKTQIVWGDPSVANPASYYDQFDVVIVGLAPITGLGSTRAYGALSAIGHLYNDPKLRLFVDAPNPAQITHSITSILKTPDSMLKPFYSNRHDYKLACEPEARLHIYTAIRKLSVDIWPETFYPKLPWDQEDLISQLPEGAKDQVTPINLDAVSLRHEATLDFPKVERWVGDDLKSKWTETAKTTLSQPVESMKRNKFSTDSEVDVEMATSTGVLISPTRKGRTWWTYRIPQALRLGVPVVTETRDSSPLGSEWAMRPAQLEKLSEARRTDIAGHQLLSYSTAIGTVPMAVKNLKETLGIE